MSTNYIAPIWRMPRNANKDKLSNYSINLANANERISLTDGVDLGVNSTVSLWVNFSTNNNSVILADDVNPSSSGYFLLLNTSTGDTYVRIGSSFGSTPFNTSWNLNQWYNIIIVRQGDTVELFKDNVSLGTRSGYGTTNTTKFDCIGAKNDQTFPTYGQISQVVGFDYALSTNQRDYIYNLNNPMAITGAKPVAYLPLGDNSNPNAPGSFPNISVGADSVFEFSTQDYIEYPYVNIDSAFTVSTWVKTTDTSTYGNLFSSSNQFGGGSNIFNNWKLIRWNRSARFNASNSSNSIIFDVNTGTAGTRPNLYDGNWHHVVGIWDGTTNANGVKIFFDGVLRGLGAATSTAINTDSSIPIRAGSSLSNFDFIGEQANQQIWNTALTYGSAAADGDTAAGEVAELYNNGQPLMTGTQPQEDNLQAWYKLDQSANWEADTAGKWQIPDAMSSYPQSFKFNENQDYISSDLNLDEEKVHAVSFWIKNKQASGLGYVLNTRPSSYGPGFTFVVRQLDNSGYIFSNVRDTPTTTQSNASGYQSVLGIPQDNNWHHVLFTHDITTGKLKAYIDGLFKYEQLPTSRTDSNTINPLTISSDQSVQDFGGYISNVMIWEDVVLTDGGIALNDPALEQVAEVYNNGVPLESASVAPANLKAWYKLDNTELFDGTNWSVENQKHPANYFKAIDTTSGAFRTSTTALSDFMGSSVTNFTWSMWVRNTSGDTGSSSLVSWSYPGSSSYKDGIHQWYGNLALFGTATNKILFGSINDGLWKHILIAVDLTAGSTWDDCVKCFINGQPRAMTSSTGTPPTSMDWTAGGTNQRDIGVGVGLIASHSFHGDISNYTLYNSTLGQTEATALYNNGTPVTTAVGSPTAWWKINNLTTGLEDVSGNSYNIEQWGTTQVEIDTFVSTEAGTSSDMTEQNLVNNNVSVLNGESVSMNTTNLVQSNLTRKVPFSNYSIYFDGTDYFGNNVTTLDSIAGAMSISCWVYFSSSSATSLTITNKGTAPYSTSTRDFELYLNYVSTTTRQIRFSGDSTSSSTYVNSVSNINSDEWTHIAITTAGDNTASNTKIYINGQLDNTDDFINISNTSSPFYVGIRSDASGRPYVGNISNMAFWDDILTDDDVLNIYNNGVTQDLNNFRIQPTCWFPIDENASFWEATSGDWETRDLSNNELLLGNNTGAIDEMQGNAPGSDANGSGVNLVIEDLKGNMYNSDKNAYSINMADYADGVTNPANSGRSTQVPSV